jgi:hypothetical protein
MPEEILIKLDREDALFLVNLVLNNAEYEDDEDAEYFRHVASRIKRQIPS